MCVLLDCGLELASLLTFLPDGLKDSLNSEEFKKSLPSLNFKQIGANTYINSAPKFHLPQLSLIDISSVDAIVITNFYNILALPYITEYTGFKGKIYATEPTIQMGRYTNTLCTSFTTCTVPYSIIWHFKIHYCYTVTTLPHQYHCNTKCQLYQLNIL